MPLHDRKFGALIRATLAGLSAIVLMTAAAPGARAQDEESEKADFGTNLMRNVLSGIGLQSPGSRPDIDYRERSPLVVPPKLDLPPPEAPGATNNPQWPNDPDVKRRREAAAARKREVYDSSIDDSRLLTPAEMARGRAHGANARAAARGNRDVDETVLPASEMTKGSKGGLFSIFSSEPETAVFTEEPPRTSLTEPPRGYRTPSPGQAYGVNTKAAPAQPYDLKNKKGTEE